MRRNRIIFLILYVLSLVAVSFRGGVISYGFLATLTLIPVISFLYILFVMIRFRIYQKLDGINPVAGTTSSFYFTLQNESLIAFSGIRVGFYSSFSTISGLDDSIEYELAPRSGIKKETGIVCRYRGEYEVGIKNLVVQDFFRLFSITYKNREPLRVRVKPAVITLLSLRCEKDDQEGGRDSLADRPVPDVLVREYQRGDDIRMMHWKATAATGKFMIRERTDEMRTGTGIVMCPHRTGKDPQKYLPVENKMLEAVIALAYYYCRKNTPTDVIFSADDRQYTLTDMTCFEDLYSIMSGIDFDESLESTEFYTSVLRRGDLSKMRTVYLITHEGDGAAAGFVKEASGLGVTVNVFIVGDQPACGFDEGTISRCSTFLLRCDDDLAEVM